MASTRLTRDFSSQTATNDKKCTISFWFKFTENLDSASDRWLFGEYTGSQDHAYIYLRNDKSIGVYGRASGSSTFSMISNKKFYDQSAWYHCVVACDTTLATSADRIKMYINGEQITSWATGSYPGQDLVLRWNNDGAYHYIGGVNGVLTHYDGLMSHFHLCDGQQLAPTVFGSTDSTTGEWKIETNPSFTPGTCGFSILKDGNSVTDVSANSNNWTVQGGTLTKTEDCPSNNFCTLNRRANYSGNLNITGGNLSVNESANSWQMASSTLGANTGKFYYEYKITTLGYGSGFHKIGFISGNNAYQATGHLAEPALDGGYAFYCQNGNLEVRTDNAVISGYSNSDLGVSFTNGDIMCLAIDMTNKKAYFRKNGDAWIKSGDPVNGTNGLDISGDYPTGTAGYDRLKQMIPAVAVYYGGAGSINFGNGYFGTTAVSSAGTNASGNGIFEFDVPNGYTAISTKGLNL